MSINNVNTTFYLIWQIKYLVAKLCIEHEGEQRHRLSHGAGHQRAAQMTGEAATNAIRHQVCKIHFVPPSLASNALLIQLYLEWVLCPVTVCVNACKGVALIVELSGIYLLKEPLNASRSYDPVFLLCLGSC
jgi:hypothetical protein